MAKVLLIAGLPSSLVNFRGALIEAMIANGHTVHVAAPAPDDRTIEWMTARAIDYHEIDLDRAGLSAARDLRALASLRKAMTDIRPDAVFAYTIKPIVYGLLAAASVGVARRFALITGLGYAFTEGDRSAKRQFARVMASGFYFVSLRFVTKIFFENPDDARLFREWGLLPRRVTPVVVNGTGVNIERFALQPTSPGARFLMVSRLLADKGVREFVEAARIVKRKYPEASFDLVGPMDANPTQIKPDLITGAVAEGAIAYHGATTDVRPFLAASSVFVLPSYREGTPVSSLEAMAVGRAILTTDVPGCRETVIEGENGFLVPARDIESLAGAMERFLKEPDLAARFGRRSREICEDRYDVRKVNAVLLSEMGLAADPQRPRENVLSLSANDRRR